VTFVAASLYSAHGSRRTEFCVTRQRRAELKAREWGWIRNRIQIRNGNGYGQGETKGKSQTTHPVLATGGASAP